MLQQRATAPCVAARCPTLAARDADAARMLGMVGLRCDGPGRRAHAVDGMTVEADPRSAAPAISTTAARAGRGVGLYHRTPFHGRTEPRLSTPNSSLRLVRKLVVTRLLLASDDAPWAAEWIHTRHPPNRQYVFTYFVTNSSPARRPVSQDDRHTPHGARYAPTRRRRGGRASGRPRRSTRRRSTPWTKPGHAAYVLRDRGPSRTRARRTRRWTWTPSAQGWIRERQGVEARCAGSH